MVVVGAKKENLLKTKESGVKINDSITCFRAPVFDDRSGHHGGIDAFVAADFPIIKMF